MPQIEMLLDDVAALKSGDVYHEFGEWITVGEAGPYLERYYETTPRWNYRGGVTGMFWEKVAEVADILRVSNEWPFEPVQASNGRLYDGHHRVTAALQVQWDKPIPVETW